MEMDISLMTSETLHVAELRSLLQELASNGESHLAEVEADLSQTTTLLAEAIEKLGVSFFAIHNAVLAQQKALDVMLSAQNLSETEAGQLEIYRQKIADEVGTAVTGLQFQDLTAQLITRIIKRIAGLKELLTSLDEYGDTLNHASSNEDIAKLLESINQTLRFKSNVLTTESRKSVSQQDMDSGDIELF
jgi:replicative superfamily II helicase